MLAPHTDDETLGCGGTIAKLVERGYDVFVYAFSTGTATHKEFNHAVHALGATPCHFDFPTRLFHDHRQSILDIIIDIRKEKDPRIVFLPAPSDCHQDHQVVSQEGIRAFKHTTVYGYELSWNSLNFNNTCYFILSGDHIGKKFVAMNEYESQRGRIYFQDENMLSLARVRGMQANTIYAECFEVIRTFL